MDWPNLPEVVWLMVNWDSFRLRSGQSVGSVFWFKLANVNYKFEFSNMYKFLYEMYKEGKYKSPFLSTTETVFNGTGLCGIWTDSFDLNRTQKTNKNNNQNKN